MSSRYRVSFSIQCVNQQSGIIGKAIHIIFFKDKLSLLQRITLKCFLIFLKFLKANLGLIKKDRFAFLTASSKSFFDMLGSVIDDSF